MANLSVLLTALHDGFLTSSVLARIVFHNIELPCGLHKLSFSLTNHLVVFARG